MNTFQILLNESVSKHGHLCAGQVIGVRMAMLGCRLIGIEDPKDPRFRKKIMVFVEIDRCATDAIASVTGCQLGKRTMKFKDFGINAATFLNLETDIAYRIVSTESSREHAPEYAPQETSPQKQQHSLATKTCRTTYFLLFSRFRFPFRRRHARPSHAIMPSASAAGRRYGMEKSYTSAMRLYAVPAVTKVILRSSTYSGFQTHNII